MGIKVFLFVFIAFLIMLMIVYLRSIRKIKYSTNMEVDEINLESQKIDDSIFNDISRKFIFAGFEHEGDYEIDWVDMGARDFFKSFIYKDLSTRARITYTDIRSNGKHLSKYSFNILTQFEDGLKIITRGNNEKSLFKENETYINEISNLEHINGAIKKHIDQAKELSKYRELKPILESESYEIQLSKEMKNLYENQVDQGILKQYGKGFYKFTIKGMIRAYYILTKSFLRSIEEVLNEKENSFSFRQENSLDRGLNSSKDKRNLLKKILVSISIYIGVFFLIVVSVLLRR